jgi:hypothetical protein
MTPLERAIELLTGYGYRQAQQPFPVGSTSYSFDAVLTADRSLDLVILQDTTIGSAELLRRNLVAFSRSLDVLGSRRTLTLVLVGQPLDATTLEALAKVCRVLPVGTLGGKNADRELRDWLAVLLPLELPDAAEVQGDWRAEVLSGLSAILRRPAASYLDASEQGAGGVRAELKRRVEKALGTSTSELEP